MKATLVSLQTPNVLEDGPAGLTKVTSPTRRNTRCCGHVRVGCSKSIGSLTGHASDTYEVEKRESMFLAIGFVLLLLWLGGFFVFHVTAFFIHILLLLAVVSIIFHFMRGATSHLTTLPRGAPKSGAPKI